MTRHRTTFTTAPYFRGHHRYPRGHGLWWFQYATTREAFAADLVGESQGYYGTLTEARRQFEANHQAPEGAAFLAVLS